MSALPRFLGALTDLLARAGIPYMITGSLGSGYHGEPRASRDVDLVISATAEQLEMLLSMAGGSWYVSPGEARDALENRTLFNLVDLDTGWKADLIFVKEREFSSTEFARRRPASVQGLDVFVVSAEDAILSKLEWAKESRSELQLRDVAAMLRAQGDSLDAAYLRRWADELGVREALERLLGDERADRPRR